MDGANYAIRNQLGIHLLERLCFLCNGVCDSRCYLTRWRHLDFGGHVNCECDIHGLERNRLLCGDQWNRYRHFTGRAYMDDAYAARLTKLEFHRLERVNILCGWRCLKHFCNFA